MKFEVALPKKEAKGIDLKEKSEEKVRLLVEEKSGWAVREKDAKVFEADEGRAKELFLEKNVRILRWKA